MKTQEHKLAREIREEMAIDRGLNDAKANLAEISQLMTTYDTTDTEEAKDTVCRELEELPLSVETKQTAEILLSWGGPATRIVATRKPEEAIEVELQYQDWNVLWTALELTDEQETALLAYVDFLGVFVE